MTNNNHNEVERGQDKSRGWSDDMSAEAVWQRLQKVEQLYQAWLVLSRGKRIPADPTLKGGPTSPSPRSTQ
jgi:hypothetical protein